ncbi:protoglobin domain-containing protein [Thiolinea disciformis]|uniref:protoglobin domain-containing protein n=1 Tax=Thiolinea disciformis TaxID=125614 RepID=UPI000362D2FD|nr:protoglobin domain-containing protein [Thiolinea disciformis]
MNLDELTTHILEKIPQVMFPTVADAQLIRAHRSFFEKHEAELIKGFYDTLYQEPVMRMKLKLEERKQREHSLRQWYRVTIGGNFDRDYWNWQTFVGIVHVKHEIANSAFLSMWGWMLTFLSERIFQELPSQEAQALLNVLQKLQVVVTSLIVESFIITEREAIKRSSGLKETLLARFVYLEIDQLLKQGVEIIQGYTLSEKLA